VDVALVNGALRAAAQGKMKGILQYSEDPLVSSDIIGNPHSSIVDSELTNVKGKRLIKIFSWYDNEMGFSHRAADMLLRMM
jgi:glyceraldehyde 3-phosphate dehydrogenase